MSEIIKIIGSKVIDAGLWKLYVAFAVFFLTFLINHFSQEKGISEKIMIIATILLMSVLLVLIILGHLSKFI